MRITEAIRERLMGHAALSGLVGERIHALHLPQGPILPAVTYQRISTPRVYSQDGYSGLAHPRWQFDAWAESYDMAYDVAEALVSAVNDMASDDLDIYAATVENQSDGYEPDTGLYRQSVDAIIYHGE